MLGLLTEDSSGITVKAKDAFNDRFVSVKMLRHFKDSDDRVVRAFLREDKMHRPELTTPT